MLSSFLVLLLSAIMLVQPVNGGSQKSHASAEEDTRSDHIQWDRGCAMYQEGKCVSYNYVNNVGYSAGQWINKGPYAFGHMVGQYNTNGSGGYNALEGDYAKLVKMRYDVKRDQEEYFRLHPIKYLISLTLVVILICIWCRLYMKEKDLERQILYESLVMDPEDITTHYHQQVYYDSIDC